MPRGLKSLQLKIEASPANARLGCVILAVYFLTKKFAVMDEQRPAVD